MCVCVFLCVDIDAGLPQDKKPVEAIRNWISPKDSLQRFFWKPPPEYS